MAYTANNGNGLQHQSRFVCNCCRLILFSEQFGYFKGIGPIPSPAGICITHINGKQVYGDMGNIWIC